MRLRTVSLSLIVALAAALLLSGCSGSPSSSGSSGGSGSTSTAGSGSGTGAASIDAAAIINQRCTRCHNTARIKAADHDQAAWESTVSRMRGKGAQVNDSEASAIVSFLSSGGAQKL